jgi:hypothetical protein
MTLADAQRRLAAALLSGETGDVADLFEGGRRSPRTVLDVYCESIVAGLAGVLAGHFPNTRRSLGHAAFTLAAKEFVRLHPPRSPLLSHYGGDFPGFLACAGRTTAEASVAKTARREWDER